MAKFMGFTLTQPRLTELSIFYAAAPGAVVRKVHHTLVGKIATETSREMKKQISVLFRPYSPSDRVGKRNKRKRWQTPTGAMQQSIGQKVVSASQMRSPDKLAIAFVGARSDFKVSKRVRARLQNMSNLGFGKAPRPLFAPRGPKGQTVSPVRYFHLALKGHGPGPKGLSFHARGRDFMTPTISAVEPRMRRIIRTNYPKRFRKVMEQEARRLIKRNPQITTG